MPGTTDTKNDSSIDDSAYTQNTRHLERRLRALETEKQILQAERSPHLHSTDSRTARGSKRIGSSPSTGNRGEIPPEPKGARGAGLESGECLLLAGKRTGTGERAGAVVLVL